MTEEIINAKVGDKVKMFGQKRRFTVMARDARYIILTKNCFGKPLYTILDLEYEWMGPDYMVFGIYDYSDRSDCEEALRALQKGELEISRRRGISFEEYEAKFEEDDNTQIDFSDCEKCPARKECEVLKADEETLEEE